MQPVQVALWTPTRIALRNALFAVHTSLGKSRTSTAASTSTHLHVVPKVPDHIAMLGPNSQSLHNRNPRNL